MYVYLFLFHYINFVGLKIKNETDLGLYKKKKVFKTPYSSWGNNFLIYKLYLFKKYQIATDDVIKTKKEVSLYISS